MEKLKNTVTGLIRQLNTALSEKDFLQLIKNKKFLMIISIVLVIAILFTSVFGIAGAISGKKVNCEKEAEAYNSTKVTYAELGTGISEEALSFELDELDIQLAQIIASINIDTLLYTDTVATAVAKFTAELTEKDFASLKFSALKKNFSEAYAYVTAKQAEGATWDTVGTIPFGIADGDKQTFIKACGAGAEHLGSTLLKVVGYELSSYYHALVISLEATHNGAMPSFLDFVKETGLSSSERIEFLVERILRVIDPIKQAPLTYLCDIVPDFIINYNKACELLNSNKRITDKAKLTMPTIDSIVKQLVSALGMSVPDIDYSYLSRMGTASVSESGGNDGERVLINGDREIVFAYLADFITSLVTYADNFSAVEKILTQDLKSDTVQSGAFASLLISDKTNRMIASLMDILAKLKKRNAVDVNAQVTAYNAESKDYSSLFTGIFTKETLSSAIDSVDSTLADAFSDTSFEQMLFSDSFATQIAKLTAKLCGKDFTILSFSALKRSFPEAYNYVKAEQASGKTWDDIETIPFGITAGDRQAFIKACAAGAEHFGDALALCLLVDPHSYDECLVPLLEALHTGAMPKLEDFVVPQGIDGAKRMEDILTKALTILEPVKTAPLTYILKIIPDFISSYNKTVQYMSDNPSLPLKLSSINTLLNDLVAGTGIQLPEYDFTQLEKMATATVAESGSYAGLRMELTGDREVVFISIANYVREVINYGNNKEAIVTIASEALGIDSSVVYTLLGVFDSVSAAFSSSGI